MNKKTFPAVNLNIPTMIFWLMLFAGFSGFMFWLLFRSNNIYLDIILISLSLLAPFLITYSLTARIILTDYSITKKSFLGEKVIEFSDVKSFGVYSTSGNLIRVLKKSELHKKDSLSQKFIYVANRKKYSPNSFKQKGSVRFHYFRKLYEEIENRLRNASS